MLAVASAQQIFDPNMEGIRTDGSSNFFNKALKAASPEIRSKLDMLSCDHTAVCGSGVRSSGRSKSHSQSAS